MMCIQQDIYFSINSSTFYLLLPVLEDLSYELTVHGVLNEFILGYVSISVLVNSSSNINHTGGKEVWILLDACKNC